MMCFDFDNFSLIDCLQNLKQEVFSLDLLDKPQIKFSNYCIVSYLVETWNFTNQFWIKEICRYVLTNVRKKTQNILVLSLGQLACTSKLRLVQNIYTCRVQYTYIYVHITSLLFALLSWQNAPFSETFINARNSMYMYYSLYWSSHVWGQKARPDSTPHSIFFFFFENLIFHYHFAHLPCKNMVYT